MKSLTGCAELALAFREVPAPVHPAEDAAQAATTGVARGDPAIDPCAVEGSVLALVPFADDLLCSAGQLDRIESRRARRQKTRIRLHTSKKACAAFNLAPVQVKALLHTCVDRPIDIEDTDFIEIEKLGLSPLFSEHLRFFRTTCAPKCPSRSIHPLL